MDINILDTGAIADGVTLNTISIQKAIDMCAESGGGRVEVPAGVFVTGTLWLKSHVELHLSHGAVLKGSTNMDDYNDEDAYPQNYGSVSEQWVGKHMIIALDQTDVSISGNGTFDGSADAFFETKKETEHSYIWSYGLAMAKNKETLRPGQMVVFVQCDRIRVLDVTFRNSPCWDCFFHGCQHVLVRGIHVMNEKHFGNTDGIDIDTCRYVTVSDCIIDTGDDAIAIRSDSTGLLNGMDCCEYVTITNCVVGSCSSVFRFGVGVGKIRNITLSNINIFRGGRCIHIMSAYLTNGCSKMENIHISNVIADNVGFPITIEESNNAWLRNITIDNFRARGMCSSGIFAADKGSVSGITLRNVDIELIQPPFPVKENEAEERGDVALIVQGAKDVRLENVNITVPQEISHKWRKTYEVTDSENVIISGCNFA